MSAPNPTARAASSPWHIVIGGAIGCAVSGGVVTIYAFGIFAQSFMTEFGWDRSVYAFCLTFFLIASGFGTVWLGALIHRWSVRRPTIALVAAFAAGIAVIAALPPVPLLFYIAFAFLGVTGAAATAMPYAVAVSGWFDRNRGLALGLVSTGAGVGTILAPQLASYLDQRVGWRSGILGIALIVAFAAIGSLIFLVRDPPPARSPKSPTHSSSGYLRQRSFWLIAIPVLGISVTVFGVTGSFVPMLADRALPAATIAAVLSASGLSSWVGRILVGYAMDRVFAPYVAALTFLFALAGVGLLALGGTFSSALVGAVLVGFALGAEGDIVTFLASRYFPMTQYSRVLGAMWVVWAWGGGIGTAIVGLTHRATHSYDAAFAIFSAMLVVSTVLVSRLGAYVYPQHAGELRPTATVAADRAQA